MNRKRARERALTLVEVLIVMVIAVFLVGGMAFASGQIQRSRLKASSARVATAMRIAFNRAASTGNDLRLVVDIGEGTIWLEESQEKMLLQSKDTAGTGGADPATAGEKAAAADATRVLQGPQSPRPTFTPVPGPAGQPQPLHNGIIVRAIDAAHDEKPKTAGRGYVYFFGAQAERASVQLAIKGSDDNKDTFSVVLAPLTGRATIMEGPIPVAHPRDDAEASEAEDDGR